MNTASEDYFCKCFCISYFKWLTCLFFYCFPCTLRFTLKNSLNDLGKLLSCMSNIFPWDRCKTRHTKEIKASQKLPIKMNSYPWNAQNRAPKIHVGLYLLLQRAIRWIFSLSPPYSPPPSFVLTIAIIQNQRYYESVVHLGPVSQYRTNCFFRFCDLANRIFRLENVFVLKF